MRRALTDLEKDERRTALLEAALDEFFARGFAAARMDDIARQAGVSKGTLYLYFTSKDAMFKGIVETFAIPNLEEFERLSAQSHSGVGAIKAILSQAPEHIREKRLPRLMKIIISDSGTFPATVRAYREQVIDRLLSIVTALLRKARNQGEIGDVDPELTARLVIAPIAFSGLWQVLFSEAPEAQVDLDKLLALHSEIITRGLRAKEPCE